MTATARQAVKILQTHAPDWYELSSWLAISWGSGYQASISKRMLCLSAGRRQGWASVIAFFVLWSHAGNACETLLLASRERARAGQYLLTDRGRQALVRAGLLEPALMKILRTSLTLPQYDSANHFWLVVFDPERDPKHHGYMDLGYKIDGHFLNGKLRIEGVEPTQPEWEQTYFKNIAASHAMTTPEHPMRKTTLGCNSLSVKPWVEVKLKLKHRLDLSEIMGLLEAPEDGPAPDDSHGADHFVVFGHGSDGGRIRIVLGLEAGHCPLRLITAFTEYR